METRICRLCGEEKSLTVENFAFDKRGRGSFLRVCRVCRNKRDSEVRANVLRTNIVRKCDKGIWKRQSKNSDFCLISERDVYTPISHMLDNFGFVKSEFKGTYEGLIRLPNLERIKRLAAKERNIFEKKAIRGFKVIKEPKQATIDRSLQITVEFIIKAIYQRLRSRLKKYVRTYGVDVPKQMYQLQGRSIDLFFQQAYGYSCNELLSRLSETFPIGTDWIDFMYGRLHVDHISPMNIFDLSDIVHVRNCYALTNLQLLCAQENIKKSDKCDLS